MAVRDLIGSVVELARPSNKAPPVPYTGRGRTGLFAGLTGHGAPDRERQSAAMGGNGTLFSVISQLAIDTSAVEWHMHRFRPGSRDECPLDGCDATGVELVEEHAALDVWNRPNDFMSRQELVEQVQQHCDLTGEGWPVFAKTLRLPWPDEIWPVYPHRMSPVPDREKFISGYVYQSPDGELVPLGLKEVGLLRQPHPLDVMRGLSAVGALSVDLDTAGAARLWNRNFFLNSAQPGGIVKVPRRLSDDEFDEMTSRWREQHQGVSAAHRVAILEGEGTDWQTVQYSMKDMQFTELLGVSRTAILEAYRFPESMLGASGDVNRATANTHKAQYAENLIVPRAKRWKGMLNRRFLPAFGATATGLEFAFVSPVPADLEAQNAERNSKATAAREYVVAGFTGESVVEALGLPEALVWEKPEPASGPFGGPPGAAPAPPKGPPTDGWHAAVQGIVGGYDQSYGPGPHTTGTTARRPLNAVEIRAAVDLDQLQTDWRDARDQLLADWEGVTAAWRDQIAERVRVAANAGDLTALTSTTLPSAEAAELLTAAMEQIAASGADRMAAEAQAQGQSVVPGVVAVGVLAAVAGALAGLLAVAYALAGAREALRWHGYGRDGDAVARGVRTLLDGWAAPKGQLGGVLTWAQNAGRLATLQAAPKATYYASEANDDRNRCGPCEKIDGKELPTFDAMMLAYGGGGYLFCEGRERCRGTAIAVWE